MEQVVNLKHFKGGTAGVTVVIIPEKSLTEEEAASRFAALNEVFELHIVLSGPSDRAERRAAAKAISAELANRRVRYINLLASGEGAALAVLLCATSPKLVRRLTLIDPSLPNAHDSSGGILNFLNRVIPQGLPLRQRFPRTNPYPNLHRVRCPTLIVFGNPIDATNQQAEIMALRIPNSWTKTVPQSNTLSGAIIPELKSFFDAPVKRPQKNLAVANG